MGVPRPACLTLLAMLGSAGFATIHAQQEEVHQQQWELGGIRARWCVYYLVDSALADKKLPNHYQPVAASRFPNLSPAVARVVQDEPAYAAWIPAQLCTIHFDVALVDQRRAGDSGTSLETSQMMTAWLIGGEPEPGDGDEATGTSATAPLTEPSYYIVSLRSDNWRLLRQGELWLIPSERAETELGYAPEDSTQRLYDVKLGRTHVTWIGHLAGDSATAAAPVQERWYVRSSRNSQIAGVVRIAADSSQAIAGSLRITGKDDLAKSLRASPIRMVGPMTWGGMAQLTFSR